MKNNGGFTIYQTNYNQQKGLLTVKEEETSKPKENNGRLVPFLSQSEMNERRAKGLCYYCDDKYSFAHAQQHKKPQLYTMDYDNEELSDEVLDVREDDNSEIAQISVNAIAGITDYTTMKVKGTHGKKTIYVLIDSDYTHNFIDIKVANLLGCKLQEAGRARVSVADGTKINVCGKIAKFKWNFQGHQFSTDFMVILLGRHDVVLGVRWLAMLGPITWDFQKLVMQFKWGKKTIVLNGITAGSVREIKAKKMEKSKETDMQLHMIYTYEENTVEPLQLNVMKTQGNSSEVAEELQRLVEKYGDIFDEPKSLPPF